LGAAKAEVDVVSEFDQTKSPTHNNLPWGGQGSFYKVCALKVLLIMFVFYFGMYSHCSRMLATEQTSMSIPHVWEMNVAASDNDKAVMLTTVVLGSSVSTLDVRRDLIGVVMSYSSSWRVAARKASCSHLVRLLLWRRCYEEDLKNSLAIALYMKYRRCGGIKAGSVFLWDEYEAEDGRTLTKIRLREGPYGSIWTLESLESAPYH
jgi:hypothetical protein